MQARRSSFRCSWKLDDANIAKRLLRGRHVVWEGSSARTLQVETWLANDFAVWLGRYLDLSVRDTAWNGSRLFVACIRSLRLLFDGGNLRELPHVSIFGRFERRGDGPKDVTRVCTALVISSHGCSFPPLSATNFEFARHTLMCVYQKTYSSGLRGSISDYRIKL